MNGLRSFFKWMFPPKQKSIYSALITFIPKQQLLKLIARTPDKRDLVRSAASCVGYSEQEFIFLLAEKINLPVTFQLPESTLVKDEVQREIFSQAGAFPISQDGELLGIACVDPVLCDEIMPHYANVNKWLSSWDVIKNALKEHALKKLPPPHQVLDQSEIGKKVIHSIIRESKKFNGQKIAIQLGEKLRYEILTADHKTAKGDISEKARRSLEDYLSSSTVHGVISVDDNLPELRISHNEVLDRYILELDDADDSEQSSPGDNVVSFPKNNSRGENPRGRPRKNRVLIVEDNETFAKVLDRFLKKHGIEGIFAQDGREGLKNLEKFHRNIRAIICDVHMPRMNGFEFVKTLRSNNLFDSIPCIMLTSDTDVETELSLLHEGVDVFIGKQQDPRLLAFHINKVVGKRTKKAA